DVPFRKDVSLRGAHGEARDCRSRDGPEWNGPHWAGRRHSSAAGSAAFPHLGAAQQREAHEAADLQLFTTVGGLHLDRIGLAAGRVEDLASSPGVTLPGHAPDDLHALDRLVLPVAAALAAHRIGTLVGLQHFA